MTKAIFIFSSISSGLEFLSLNHNSIYENFETEVVKNVKVLGEIFEIFRWFIWNKYTQDSYIWCL